MILALLFVLTSSPIAPYFWQVFWGANTLWVGAALIFIVGIFVWVLMAGN